jgi:hypothetical protein
LFCWFTPKGLSAIDSTTQACTEYFYCTKALLLDGAGASEVLNQELKQ